MDRRRTLGLAATVALLAGLTLVWAPAGTAQEPDATVVGVDFDLTFSGGSLSFPPGEEVRVAFRNDGNAGHNLHVADRADADPDNDDTPTDAAIAATQTLSQGGEETLVFTVPADADALYFWCDVGQGAHESSGMFLTAVTGTDGDGTTSTPLAPWLALVALMGAAVGLAVLRRRR